LKVLRIAFLALATCAGAVLAARLLFGPLHFAWLSVNAPLNPEGLFGVAITALLLMRPRETSMHSSGGRILLPALAVAIVTFVALRGALAMYFLSDDFLVIRIGRDWTAASIGYIFTHGGGDGFFRPAGFLAVAVAGKWAGVDPLAWHAWSLAIHIANSILVMLLARRLGASAFSCAFAGMLFGVHGTRPEAAVWIAGQFDLLATFFVLAGLLFFTMLSMHDTSVRYTLHAAALACFALGALSKESAFVFPLFLVVYVLWKRQPLAWCAPYFFLAAALFIFRWTLFGGIGGYVDAASGRPAALSLGFGSTIKAVAVRVWTALYFPVNWTRDPSWIFALLSITYIAACLWLAVRARPAQQLWPSAAAILIACIPPLSLLSGSPAMAGARVLYLPSVWFATLLALAIDGLASRARYAVAAVMLLFQFAAFEHNLGFWKAASARVKAECATGAPALPDSIDGVPAYANGKQECIEITRAQP
jgi:hypothetical protein